MRRHWKLLAASVAIAALIATGVSIHHTHEAPDEITISNVLVQVLVPDSTERDYTDRFPLMQPCRTVFATPGIYPIAPDHP